MIISLIASLAIGPFWVEPIAHGGHVDEYDVHRNASVVMVVQLGNGWPEFYDAHGMQLAPDLNDNDMDGSVWG